MTTFSGSFSTTDKDATIRPKKDPIDEVIDILTDPTGGSGPPSARAMQQQRPAPVNVGMMPERRGDVNIPMQPSEFKRLQPGQQSSILRNLGLNSADYQMDPKDNLGFVQSPFTTALNLDPDMFDQDTGDIINYPVGGGRGGPFDGGNFLTSIPFNLAANKTAAENFRQQELDRMQGTAPLGLPSIGVNPVSGIGYPEYSPRGGGSQAQGLGAIDPYEQFGDNLLGGDASTVYGINPVVKRIAEFQGYDMDTDEGVRKYLADTQKTMEDSGDALEARRKDQDREMAAMLAAQQQQPVDPCPEGYRLDPVSKVCVPTDDATEPDNITPRTYDTMTRPEPNYTPATNFNLPAITLPDILMGN